MKIHRTQNHNLHLTITIYNSLIIVFEAFVPFVNFLLTHIRLARNKPSVKCLPRYSSLSHSFMFFNCHPILLSFDIVNLIRYTIDCQ